MFAQRLIRPASFCGAIHTHESDVFLGVPVGRPHVDGSTTPP
jgi:hypothetical protein